jgi:hypothetical protein
MLLTFLINLRNILIFCTIFYISIVDRICNCRTLNKQMYMTVEI